ncbi:MAG TPA: 30S ribosomal protein S21 [Limnochordia bacterium]
MAEIKVGKDEPLDRALRRFKKSLRQSGVLSELRRREHYLKPSVKKKKKADAARKRRAR